MRALIRFSLLGLMGGTTQRMFMYRSVGMI
jgi:hypothetical protein